LTSNVLLIEKKGPSRMTLSDENNKLSSRATGADPCGTGARRGYIRAFVFGADMALLPRRCPTYCICRCVMIQHDKSL
jgi:hypothetical protein